MERYLKIIGQSIRAIQAFRLRTLFCLLSVALGISSITIIVAATEGAYKKALEIVDRFGPDGLLILGGSEQSRAIGQREKTITIDDVKAMQQAFPTAYVVVPMASERDVQVSYKDRKYQTRVIGSSNDYSRAWSWPVIQGSDFTEEDVKGLRNVGLIGQHLLTELFDDEDPVGKYILLRGIPVQIVGVLSERGITPAGQRIDDRIIIPYTTLMKKIQNEHKYVTGVRMRFSDKEHLYQYADELTQFLRKRHRIPLSDPDDFRIISPKEIIKFLVALTGSLVAFLGVVGIISLIVAGFVLGNLFILSVKERAKEIGIRRSVGAKKSDIMVQFLGEALILTTAGGILGFVFGYLSSKLLVLIAEFQIYFSWKAFAIGLILSWIVGVSFGLQPASRAANINPIEAVRE